MMYYNMSARRHVGPGVLLASAAALGIVAGVSHRAAAEPRVVATIPPIHSLVAGVMAGVGEPTLLIPGGASPHAYAMRPSEARALADADIVFWVGEAMETFLERPLAALTRDTTVVELAAVSGMHPSARARRRRFRGARRRGGRRSRRHGCAGGRARIRACVQPAHLAGPRERRGHGHAHRRRAECPRPGQRRRLPCQRHGIAGTACMTWRRNSAPCWSPCTTCPTPCSMTPTPTWRRRLRCGRSARSRSARTNSRVRAGWPSCANASSMWARAACSPNRSSSRPSSPRWSRAPVPWPASSTRWAPRSRRGRDHYFTLMRRLAVALHDCLAGTG